MRLVYIGVRHRLPQIICGSGQSAVYTKHTRSDTMLYLYVSLINQKVSRFCICLGTLSYYDYVYYILSNITKFPLMQRLHCAKARSIKKNEKWSSDTSRARNQSTQTMLSTPTLCSNTIVEQRRLVTTPNIWMSIFHSQAITIYTYDRSEEAYIKIQVSYDNNCLLTMYSRETEHDNAFSHLESLTQTFISHVTNLKAL